MKLSPHFFLQELVHPDIYHKVGDRCKDFLHPNLIVNCEAIRDIAGATTINDWSRGGNFKSSGLRTPDDIGAFLSSHKFGCAADLKFKDITPLEVQRLILAEPHKFPYISRMENAVITKTWLHIESCDYRQGDIIVFNP